MKIILVGYMGSGKSVVAANLSIAMQIPFVELDILIEQRANSSIKTIFSEKGELFFRKLEHQIFNELIATKGNLIISTGGGTPCYFNNHDALQGADTRSFYLSASITTLADRLLKGKQNRPLLAKFNPSETKDFIAKHLFERSYFYHQAQYTIDVNTKSVPQVVASIVACLA